MANTKKTLKSVSVDKENFLPSYQDRTSVEGLDNVFTAQEEVAYSVPELKKQSINASEVTVSKEKLVSVLENFVSLIKTESSSGEIGNVANKVSVISFDDQASKIDNMKNLLLDAKETIINLLEERVQDKARIANLETQVKFYPDLQAQADLALTIAVSNSQTKLEITQVKCELEKFRLLRVRAELDKAKASLWNKVKAWWLS